MVARTLGEVTRQPAHWSGLEYRLTELAGAGVDLVDWLVDQANLRGFHGAWNANPVTSRLEPQLSMEELVVGLLRPRAVADVRVFKLVVRLLQSGQLSVPRLRLLARRERVDHLLHWLTGLVPAVERTPALEAVAALFREPPRGYRGVDFVYDPQRLVRRPATEGQLWRAKQS